MALKICPKCGMDNAQNQNYCSYCKFNMGAYVKKFAEETSSMNEEERKAYIYDKTSKPQAPTPPPMPYSNTWEFIKDNKKALLILLEGILCLLIGLLSSSWFLDIGSIFLIIVSICFFNETLGPSKIAQNQYATRQNTYVDIINDFDTYREKVAQEISNEIKQNMRNSKKSAQEQKIRKYYMQPIIKCPACEKEISSEAEICVHCGYPLRKMLIKKGYRADEKKSPVIQPVPTNILKCPKCGSTSITTEEIGYGTFGWIGASQKKNLCQKCGYKWWPGTK